MSYGGHEKWPLFLECPLICYQNPSRVAWGVASLPSYMPLRSPVRAKRPTKRAAKTRTMKKMSAKRAPKIKIIGKVVHYYDRIGVAIVELNSPLCLGDTVTFKRGEHQHTQQINSIQIDHTPVQKGKKGDVVGVQVSMPVYDKTFVIPA